MIFDFGLDAHDSNRRVPTAESPTHTQLSNLRVSLFIRLLPQNEALKTPQICSFFFPPKTDRETDHQTDDSSGRKQSTETSQISSAHSSFYKALKTDCNTFYSLI